MSRLYDRVMAHGCETLTLRDVLEISYESDEFRGLVADQLQEELGREAQPEEINERVAAIYAAARRTPSTDTYEIGSFDEAVVISADEVADYWASLPVGTNIMDLLDILAPPFERLFVEFQKRPNPMRLESWGVLIGTVPTEGDDGWVLGASLVGELRKGRPVGPVARWIVPLDESGRPRRGDEEGHDSMYAFPFQFADYPEEDAWRLTNVIGPLLFVPALFAISLMHCKNVDVRPFDPAERVSRKHERKHGRPLTRYYVLDIQPIRGILDKEGEAQTKGLRHALHICRGHFKTYDEDARLFGRHVGTYWWPSHVRGSAEKGVVEKDYRIRLEQGLGREYRVADEHPEIARTAAENVGLDPDLGGRGLRAHNVTQNLLAKAVEDAGWEPRRPKPEEPQYDLAWDAGDTIWVAEVKSIAPQNEERQLRLGLGQVIRYRQLLAAEGRNVKALIATERRPSDSSWRELLAQEAVVLVWPGQMAVGNLSQPKPTARTGG